MKLGYRTLCCAAMLAFVAPSWAAANATGNVVNFGTFGNGRVFVTITGTLNEAGCVKSRIDLAPTHAQAKSILAIASLAMSTGKQVIIQSNGCYGGFPTLDATASTYMQISN